jgi:uncharacterized membrane protein YdjX (TVP38/TMEM64 family)
MTDPEERQSATPVAADTAPPGGDLPAALKAAALVALLLLAFIALRFSGVTAHVSKQGIQALVSRFGLLAPAVHVAVYAVGTTALLPATLFTLIGAVLFGKFLGTIYNLLGATGGAALSFLVARYLGRDFAARLLTGRLRRLDAKAEEHGLILISYLRLAYLPFAPLNYAAGLTRMRFLDYLCGSIVGMFPAVLIFTCFLDELTNLESPADLLALRFLAPLSLFVASLFLPMLVKRLAPALNSTTPPPPGS